jgi:toxin secretion/phage lysis holin
VEHILTKVNVNRVGVSIAMAGFFATVTAVFGDITQIHKLLFAVMLLDYVSGVSAAIVNKSVSSKKAHIGVIKKISIIALVAFSHQVDVYLGTYVVCTGVIAFFIANEFMSVMENYRNIGLPIPDKLVKVMDVFAKTESKNG